MTIFLSVFNFTVFIWIMFYIGFTEAFKAKLEIYKLYLGS